MRDEIEPIASIATIELPARMRPDGWKQFEFDESGTRLVVRYMVDARTFPWISNHALDIAALVGPVVALLFVWALRRTIRRPRALGRSYCRRCSYDITPTGGEAVSAICPECGRPTRGLSMQGRRLRPWQFAVPVLCLGSVIACASLCHSGLSSTATSTAQTTWPIASLESVSPSWPFWRSEVRPHWRSEGAVYSFDLNGRLQGNAWIAPLPAEWRITADGSRLVALEFASESRWNHRALIHDFDSRTTRTFDFGTAADGLFQLASVAEDGNSALVIQTRMTPVAAGRETVILRLDLATGKLTELASTTVPSTHGENATRGYSTPDMAACVNPSAAIRWALIAHGMQRPRADSATACSGSLVIVGTADGERRFETPPARGKLWENRICTVADDFTVIIDDSMSVDLRTGECASVAYASFGFNPTREPLIVRVVEYETRAIPGYEYSPTSSRRERATLGVLDLRPQSPPIDAPVLLGPAASCAFSPRSGLCAVECSVASAQARAIFKVWRLKTQPLHGK